MSRSMESSDISSGNQKDICPVRNREDREEEWSEERKGEQETPAAIFDFII